MSAIGGVVAKGGRNLRWAIEGMHRSLRTRSLEGQAALWTQGPVGLIQGRAFSRPGEQVRLFCDGAVSVVADARLDETQELAKTLDVSPTSPPAALICAAWRRFGMDAPAHLQGDFAFAVWDADQEILFAARDRFGVKPFYYSDEGAFVFASSMGALLAAGCRGDIDEARIADFLVGLPYDEQACVYRAMRRLPPGSHLVVAHGETRIASYFRLQPQTVAPRADAAEAFREAFERAVARRLQTPAAVMLSGGLDSSSIAVVADKLCKDKGLAPPAALSMVFDEHPDVDERRYVQAVLDGRDLQACWLPSQDVAVIDGLSMRLLEQGGPYQAPSHHLSRRLYDAARSQGARVVLDGHGGDETVSFGYGRLGELAAQGRWLSLWRESFGIAKTFDASPSSIFYAYAAAYGPGRRLNRLFRRFAPAEGHDATAWRRLVAPTLATRTGLLDRWRAYMAQLPSTCADEAQLHHRTLVQSNHSAAFEVLDQSAAAAGVEPRYPFWDHDLVMLCLSLESREKLDGGYGRRILRQGLRGLLPDKVRLRRDKVDFRPQVARSLAAKPKAVEDLLFTRAGALGDYVNLSVAKQAWGRLRSDPDGADGDDVIAVWRSLVLGQWLHDLQDQSLGEAPLAAPPAALLSETIL